MSASEPRPSTGFASSLPKRSARRSASSDRGEVRGVGGLAPAQLVGEPELGERACIVGLARTRASSVRVAAAPSDAAAPLSARSASAAGADVACAEPCDSASTPPTSPPRASAAAIAPPATSAVRRLIATVVSRPREPHASQRIRGARRIGSLRSAGWTGAQSVIWITTRTITPGSYEEFREAWRPSPPPTAWFVRTSASRGAQRGRRHLRRDSFQSRERYRLSEVEAERQRAMAPFVEAESSGLYVGRELGSRRADRIQVATCYKPIVRARKARGTQVTTCNLASS